MPASTTLTAEQRTLRARVAAYTRWSRESGEAQARRGQAGLRERFRREVRAEHPDLPAHEIERRADCAYRAHMARLALASSKARAARNGGVRAERIRRVADTLARVVRDMPPEQIERLREALPPAVRPGPLGHVQAVRAAQGGDGR